MKCNKKDKYQNYKGCDFYYSSDGLKDECLLDKCEDDYVEPEYKPKMIAGKKCDKCPWKTDVGNKYVCMFKWCVSKKFNKNKKRI